MQPHMALQGTAVGRSITEARKRDLFMQPHTALEGTVRKARCYVVLDKIF